MGTGWTADCSEQAPPLEKSKELQTDQSCSLYRRHFNVNCIIAPNNAYNLPTAVPDSPIIPCLDLRFSQLFFLQSRVIEVLRVYRILEKAKYSPFISQGSKLRLREVTWPALGHTALRHTPRLWNWVLAKLGLELESPAPSPLRSKLLSMGTGQ